MPPTRRTTASSSLATRTRSWRSSSTSSIPAAGHADDESERPRRRAAHGCSRDSTTPGRRADLLRLNTAIAPTAQPNALGALAGDFQGFPNGRRLADDVTDIEPCRRLRLRADPGGCAGIVQPVAEQHHRRWCQQERGGLPLALPVRRSAQPGLQAHGTRVGRGLDVRRRTTLLVGSALAVAAPRRPRRRGVLAESRSAPPSASRERSPSGRSPGRRRDHCGERRRPRRAGSRTPPRLEPARAARFRLPASLA